MKDSALYTHLQSALATQSVEQLAACINLMEGQSSEFYAAVDYSAIKASLEQYLGELKKGDITPERIAFIQQYLQTLNTILQNGGKSTIIPSFLSVLESFKDTLFTSDNMDQFRACLTQTKKEQSPSERAKITEKPTDFEENLFDAVEKGKLDSVQYHFEVLHTKLPGDYSKTKGLTVLHIAAACGQLPVVQYLCEVAKVNTEATNWKRKTALHIACQEGHLPIVQYLCEVAKVNTEGALHDACSNNRLPVVQYLCEVAKVNTEVKDKWRKTALHWACSNGSLPVVQYLCEVAKVNTEGALHSACEKGKLPVVQYLCEVAKVNTEATDKRGQTALHIACIEGHLRVVKYLCEVAKVNTEGASSGYPEVREYLKKYLSK